MVYVTGAGYFRITDVTRNGAALSKMGAGEVFYFIVKGVAAWARSLLSM